MSIMSNKVIICQLYNVVSQGRHLKLNYTKDEFINAISQQLNILSPELFESLIFSSGGAFINFPPNQNLQRIDNIDFVVRQVSYALKHKPNYFLAFVRGIGCYIASISDVDEYYEYLVLPVPWSVQQSSNYIRIFLLTLNKQLFNHFDEDFISIIVDTFLNSYTSQIDNPKYIEAVVRTLKYDIAKTPIDACVLCYPINYILSVSGWNYLQS